MGDNVTEVILERAVPLQHRCDREGVEHGGTLQHGSLDA